MRTYSDIRCSNCGCRMSIDPSCPFCGSRDVDFRNNCRCCGQHFTYESTAPTCPRCGFSTCR